MILRKSTRNKKRVDFLYVKINIRRICMTREYRNFTREEKIKAVKMVLVDKKSQMEVERIVLGKKKCAGTINRWIREYIQEGEENSFKKKKGLKKLEITENNVRYEILKKFNAFLEKEIRTNSNLLKNSKNNIQ